MPVIKTCPNYPRSILWHTLWSKEILKQNLCKLGLPMFHLKRSMNRTRILKFCSQWPWTCRHDLWVKIKKRLKIIGNLCMKYKLPLLLHEKDMNRTRMQRHSEWQMNKVNPIIPSPNCNINLLNIGLFCTHIVMKKYSYPQVLWDSV